MMGVEITGLLISISPVPVPVCNIAVVVGMIVVKTFELGVRLADADLSVG